MAKYRIELEKIIIREDPSRYLRALKTDKEKDVLKQIGPEFL